MAGAHHDVVMCDGVLLLGEVDGWRDGIDGLVHCAANEAMVRLPDSVVFRIGVAEHRQQIGRLADAGRQLVHGSNLQAYSGCFNRLRVTMQGLQFVLS